MRPSRGLCVALLVVALAAPHAARSTDPADDGWKRADVYYPADAGWYGWQVLLVDAASVGLVAWGIERERTDLIVGGSLGFVAVPPAIHLLHGQPLREVRDSLGVRVGAPLTMGYVALRVAESACADGDTRCGAAWGLSGLAMGALMAIAVDGLAREPGVTVAPMAIRDARGAPAWGLTFLAHR
jgi:hypothetical protein